MKRIDKRAFVLIVGAVVLGACSSSADGDGTSGGASGQSSGSSGQSSGSSGQSSGSSGQSSGSSGDYNNNPPGGATRPPPSITNVAPLDGDYGTLVTITGDNLDEASAELVLAGPAQPVKFAMPVGAGTSKPSDVIMSWSKTKIEFKYPFPAEGIVGVTTKSGQAQGGSFAPSWRPGVPLSGAFTRRELLSVVSPAAGTMVAAFDGTTGPQIVIASPDGTVTSKSYNRGGSALLAMSLYVTPSNTVDGFYASGGALYQLTDATGAATTASTGVAVVDAAGGIDATGPYAWIKKSNATLVRVRPPTWAESGAAIADPRAAGAPGQSMAVAPDASLFVGWGVNDTGSFPFYDHVAYPAVRRLRAGQAAFDASHYAGSGADDDMVWTRFRAGPDGRVFSYYCANDTGFFDVSGTLDCGEGYTNALGTVDEPTTGAHGEQISGWNTTAAVTTSCDSATATLSIGPEGNTASAVKALFPCPRVIGAQPDPSGSGMMLVSIDNYVYAPRKR